jgi:hypothetical protein
MFGMAAEYILPRWGAEELEREHLSVLQEICDPFSAGQLDGIGVGEGWQ